MKKQLEYTQKGPAGYVVYKDEQSELRFYYEFGGGSCLAIIHIPTPDKWAEETKRALHEREAIVDFVAQQVLEDKAPGCTAEISDQWIVFRSHEANST